LTGEQRTLVVDDDMQPKAGEPAHGRFAALREVPKDPMLRDAAIVAHGARRGVEKRDARAAPGAGLHVHAQRTTGAT
jgi:hypothetical protein